MHRRRWLLILLDVLFLSALGGYVIVGLEKVQSFLQSCWYFFAIGKRYCANVFFPFQL